MFAVKLLRSDTEGLALCFPMCPDLLQLVSKKERELALEEQLRRKSGQRTAPPRIHKQADKAEAAGGRHLHKIVRTVFEPSNTREQFPTNTHRERPPGATNTHSHSH